MKYTLMYERTEFNGWPNCVRLYNQEIEVIVATDIGPRIIKFGYINGQNFFHLVPEHRGLTGGSEWRIYGGHRLWLAPEAMPWSYHPDNESVHVEWAGDRILLRQTKESTTGIVKEMEITLSPELNEVKVLHRLINESSSEVEVSPWAISALAQGGRAIVPQEPYGEGDDYLLPARPMALWQFTRMNDPRWIWGDRYIQARQDPTLVSEQKIGVQNKLGWTAYCLNDEILVKKFEYRPDVNYPDFGCNNEIYINGKFLEIETLGPLSTLAPGKGVEHIERWLLARVTSDESEVSIDERVLPIVNAF